MDSESVSEMVEMIIIPSLVKMLLPIVMRLLIRIRQSDMMQWQKILLVSKILRLANELSESEHDLLKILRYESGHFVIIKDMRIRHSEFSPSEAILQETEILRFDEMPSLRCLRVHQIQHSDEVLEIHLYHEIIILPSVRIYNFHLPRIRISSISEMPFAEVK